MLNLEPGSPVYRLIRTASLLVGELHPFLRGGLDGTPHRAARCIASSRALITLLKRFDIPAKPMPVDVEVYNSVAFEWKQQGAPYPSPRGARSVAINPDEGVAGKGWNGHLIVRVAKRWMIDANPQQFERDGSDGGGLLHMPTVWMWDYPERWTPKTHDQTTAFGMASKLAPHPRHPGYPYIEIRQRPDNVRYTTAPDWLDPVVGLDVMEEALRSISAGHAMPDLSISEEGVGDITYSFSAARDIWEQSAHVPADA
jgi:hypothetical protein